MNVFRRLFLPVLLICSFLPMAASAAVDEQTEISLYSAIRGIEYYVNKKYVDALVQGLSTSARPGLEEELRESMPAGNLSLLHTSWEFSELPNGHYVADTRADLEIINNETTWKTTGYQLTYELESTEQGWVIVDTNLAALMSANKNTRKRALASACVIVASAAVASMLFKRSKQLKAAHAAMAGKP